MKKLHFLMIPSSQEMLFHNIKRRTRSMPGKKKVNTFLAKTKIQTNESFKIKAQMEEIECPVCGKSHSIKDCEEFLKLGIEERSKMIFKKKLCCGCY